MSGSLRQGLWWRIAGPVACAVLLLYGIVAFSKPRDAYFLTFSFAGQLEGAFQATVQLDDGPVTAPVRALGEDKLIHVVALPTRTIRAIGLITGPGSGTIRDLRIIRASSGQPRASNIENARDAYRQIDLSSVRPAEGIRITEKAANALSFEIPPSAGRPALEFGLAPLHLLRDTQLAWASRMIIAVVILSALLLLHARGKIPSIPAAPRVVPLLPGYTAAAVPGALWFIGTFAVYFIYAGRIEAFGWNAIEFIISNHLQDFGRYALGANYPAAIWRPVGPTFIVLAIDFFVHDPVLTYQILSGLALASLTTSLYLLNRLLFGQLIAHAGAALAFTTPLVSVSLINHTHSISHLCFLLVASPTLLLSTMSILALREGVPSAPRWMWMASVGWLFCYLCRAETVLMAACFYPIVAALAFRRGKLRQTIIPLAIFMAGFAGFNAWAGANAARDDIWSRKMIHVFYTSQGWTEIFDAESRENRPIDHEAEGYVRAIGIYGTAAENSDSMFVAIARNPKAFVTRVGTNLRQFIDLLVKGKLISFELLLLLAAVPVGWLLLKPSFRLLACFAAGLCSVAGIFLALHIDDRYLAIAVPAAVFLGSLSAYGLNRLPMPLRFGGNAFASILLLVMVLHLATTLSALSDALRRERLDLSAFRQIGKGFRSVVHARPGENQQIIVQPDFPLPATLGANPILLLFPYFARTSLLLPESGLAYPRDRLFSLPHCPATHAVVPASDVRAASQQGRYVVPGVGELAVIQLAESEQAGSAPGRFCHAQVAP